MHIFDNNFREIFISQIVSMAVGMLAGFVLAFYTGNLLLLPGLLIVLPGFLELRGAISGAFSSRLSSGLFLGVISAKTFNTRLIRSNLVASFVLAIVASFVLGLIACAFTYLLSGIFFVKLILIAVVAGVIANFIEIPLALFSTFYLFRKGHDPNNIMGPFILSTGDLVSIISLAIAMVVI
ncbi:MAG TPA: magnesium transporter [archaeon]|nr:magnesium transporter [archaeon]